MDDRSGEVLAVAILFFVLCWITVSLRTYCRWRVIHSFGIDDKLLVMLLVRSLALPFCWSTRGSDDEIGDFHSISRITIGRVEAWHRKTRDRPILRGHRYSFEGKWACSMLLYQYPPS